MTTQQLPEQQEGKDRKSARRWAIAFTILYVILYPYLYFAASMSALVFDKPDMNVFLGLSFILVTLCAPISIPIAIYFMWSRYCRGEYKKTRFFCAVPIITFGAVYLVLEALSALSR